VGFALQTTGQTLRLFLGSGANCEPAKCSNVPFHQAFTHFKQPKLKLLATGIPSTRQISQNCVLTGDAPLARLQTMKCRASLLPAVRVVVVD